MGIGLGRLGILELKHNPTGQDKTGQGRTDGDDVCYLFFFVVVVMMVLFPFDLSP